tara:strand:- start:64 stop:648 length:585 start_codon:yes stop_codon:yes gene_type:complete
MKKILITFLILFGFSSTLSAADQGQMRFGVEFGFSPVDLEAEKTAQELANLSGSTVTVEYDTGSFVGRLFGEYGLSSNLDLEIGYFTTSDAEAKYTISGASATESYYADGFDFSLNIRGDDGFYGKVGMHSSTVNGSASITIGGTTYAVSASRDGSGPLVGLGYESDGVRYSATHYIDVGDTTDYTLFSVGWLF